MRNNGDTSNYMSVFRFTPPPGGPHRKVIKRNRQVVSCVPCRTRKLKCDRQQPCSSCVKRSDAVSCKFFGAHCTVVAGSHALPVPRKQLQTRLQQLEDLVNGMIAPPESETLVAKNMAGSSTTSGDEAAETSEQTPVHAQVSKEGSKVRYVGAPNYAAVLERIHDLRDIVDEEAPDHSPPRPGPYHDAQEGQQQLDWPNQSYGPAVSLTTQQIMAHMPSRGECDQILTLYFQQIYMIPMVIHAGQFQRAYEAFWRDPANTSPLWVSILFTLLSTAVFQQASKPANCEGLGATGIKHAESKEKIRAYSSMAYRCLVAGNYLQGKPYSVEAALLFVMHLVLQKRDTDPICWHTLGTAVRLAQRMGYHRDPSYLNRRGVKATISPFEAEMRRRTWYSLEHLDMAFSFLLGVPPIIHGDDVNTRLPSNLHEEEFGEHSKSLPPSRPASEFTPVLSYIFLSRQVQLLRRVVKQATATASPSYAEIIRLDADLRSLHDHVPPKLRYRPIQESCLGDAPDIIVRRILFELMHLKGLCLLHRRYLTLERGNAIYARSREACLDASLRLLDLHAELDGQSHEGRRLCDKRYLVTGVGFHVFLLAAMCLCLDLVARSASSKQQPHDRGVSALNKSRALWSQAASTSEEAAHATKVLDAIIAKVMSSGKVPTPRTGESYSYATAAAGPTSSSTEQRAPPSKPCPIAWDSEHDTLAPEQRPADPLGRGLSSHGDIDWNEIDSFLLGRDTNAATTVTSPARPVAEEGIPGEVRPYMEDLHVHGGRKPRENWPYPQYDHEGTAAKSGTASIRTWSGTGAAFAAVGPS